VFWISKIEDILSNTMELIMTMIISNCL